MINKSQSKTFKVAYIGGGSMFVPSILNGIADCMKKKGAFDVCVSLYDKQREKAERMCRYADVVSISAKATATREESLDGADLIIVSVALYDRLKEIGQALEAVNAHLPEPGPGDAGEAIAVAPFYFDLAKDMKRYCPDVTFVSVVNPTDVIALSMRAKGIKAVGMCVEVEGLRGALAYYFRVPEESIEMTYAGVNHDGWTLRLTIDGKDGYELLRKRLPEIEKDPYFHPGNYGVMRIFELTGYLRSSAYHTPPFSFDSATGGDSWKRWDGKRESQEQALEEALRTGKPITDPPMIHPERSLVNYPGTGYDFGRMIRAMVTGEGEIVPMQVINNGAVGNFANAVCVEVPTLIKGNELIPQQVGELPEWLGGITRLLGIQRRMIADYLINPSLELLKQSLSVIPILAPTERHLRFAEVIHKAYMCSI